MTFDSLNGEQVESIAQQMVARVADRLRAERGIELTVDDEYTAGLAADGFDEAYGARPLQRHIRRTLEKALTKAILGGEIHEGDHVHVTHEGALVIETEHALAAT